MPVVEHASPPAGPEAQWAALRSIVARNAWLMRALRAARSLQLASWCIGAGAIRNVVWDALHDKAAPSHLPDVDVVYFDADNTDAHLDQALQDRLAQTAPDIPWEVTNQASVHEWFEQCFGHAVAPLRSLEEAVASWPEYATAVGVWLDDADRLQLIAPYGLDDLFALRIRRNPARVSVETYRQRIAEKNYAARWPKVIIEPA